MLALAALASSLAYAQSEVIAVVNGDSILASRLEIELMRIHESLGQAQRGDFDLEKLINRIIDERLMVQEAYSLELDQSPSLLNDVHRFQTKIAVAQLMKEVLPDSYSVTDSEIRDFFVVQYRQFRFNLLTVRDKDVADSLYQTITNGASFEDLARRYSLDMYKYRGGDLGMSRWIDVEDALKSQAESMRVGDVSRPFLNRHAYSILRLSDQKPADSEELDSHRKKIVAILTARKREVARNAYFNHLKERYSARVNQDALHSAAEGLKTESGSIDGELAVAQIGDQTITADEVIRSIMRSGRIGNKDDMETIASDAVEGLIRDRALERAAADEGMLKDANVVKETEAYRDSVLVLMYLEEIVAPQIQIPVSQIDSFYQANRDDYRQPSNVKLSQITVPTEELADSVMGRLSRGASFAWLSERMSSDNYAKAGGDIGTVNLASYPDQVRHDLETRGIGQVVGPYASAGGYLILKLRDRTPGDYLPLSRVETRIRQALFQTAFNQTLDHVVSELRRNSDISINTEVVEKLSISGKKDEH